MTTTAHPRRVRSPVPIDLGHRRHGTATGYREGCGCPPCTAAQAASCRRWAEKVRQEREDQTPVVVTCDGCGRRFRAMRAKVWRLEITTLRVCRGCVSGLQAGAA